MLLGDFLLDLRGRILAVDLPSQLTEERALLAKFALQAVTPECLGVLVQGLEDLAHNRGGLVKARHRLTLCALADRCRQVAAQLPNLDAWKEATRA